MNAPSFLLESNKGVKFQSQELALSHLKGEYRKLLLEQAPMINVRCFTLPNTAAKNISAFLFEIFVCCF
jgi:hypothetical protein